MSAPPQRVSGDRFRVGDCWVEPAANEIGGSRVDAKAMDVLVALVVAAPGVVSVAQLLESVWPKVVVGDNVVHQAIAHLRKALGDDSRSPGHIQSIPRRGYRLIAKVEHESAAAPGADERAEAGGALVIGAHAVARNGPASPSKRIHIAIEPAAAPDRTVAELAKTNPRDAGGRAPSASALVVDDHPIITDALSSALVSLGVFEVIDKEPTLNGAARRLEENPHYAMVMLDIHLTDAMGLQIMHSLREQYPDVPVVIFSGDESAATITAAFEHGVHGYIPKSSPMRVVVNAIRTVLEGGIYVPPQLVKTVQMDADTAPSGRPEVGASSDSPLSPPQQQVMNDLLLGTPNKVIGAQLDMTDATVKEHLAAIYRAFGVSSRAQLILRAKDLGLI